MSHIANTVVVQFSHADRQSYTFFDCSFKDNAVDTVEE